MHKPWWRAKRFWTGAAGICLAWAICARGVLALTINEIMYDAPGSDADHEWVEIFNESGDAVTIATGTAGWRFYDGANHIINAPAQGSNTLAAGNFAILSVSTSAFLAEHPGFSGTLFYSAFSLGNITDTLRLLKRGGIVVSEATYTNTNGANGNGKSLERRTDGAWGESAVNGGTPGAANSAGAPIPTPTPQPSPSFITGTATPAPPRTGRPSPRPAPTPAPTLMPTPSTGIVPTPLSASLPKKSANSEGATSVPAGSRELAANISQTAPAPYESFFSRYALALTLLGACMGAVALVRWRRKNIS